MVLSDVPEEQGELERASSTMSPDAVNALRRDLFQLSFLTLE
jgi:hypothetical protein